MVQQQQRRRLLIRSTTGRSRNRIGRGGERPPSHPNTKMLGWVSSFSSMTMILLLSYSSLTIHLLRMVLRPVDGAVSLSNSRSQQQPHDLLLLDPDEMTATATSTLSTATPKKKYLHWRISSPYSYDNTELVYDHENEEETMTEEVKDDEERRLLHRIQNELDSFLLLVPTKDYNTINPEEEDQQRQRRTSNQNIIDDSGSRIRRRELGRPVTDDDIVAPDGNDGGGGGGNTTTTDPEPYDCSVYHDWGDMPEYCQTTHSPEEEPVVAVGSDGDNAAGTGTSESPLMEPDDQSQMMTSSDVPSESPTMLSSFLNSIVEDMIMDENNSTTTTVPEDESAPVSAPSSIEYAPDASPFVPIAPDSSSNNDGNESVGTIIVDNDGGINNTNTNATVPTEDMPVGSTPPPPTSIPTMNWVPIDEDNNGGTSSSSEDDFDRRPLPPIDIPSGIRLNISMGIIHLGDMSNHSSHTLVQMCVHAITLVLNNFTSPKTGEKPFHVTDEGLMSPVVNDTTMTTTTPTTTSESSNPSSSSSSANTRIFDVAHGWARRTSEIHADSHQQNHHHPNHQRDLGGSGSGRSHNNNNNQNHEVRLYLHDVEVRESENVDDWYVVYATYAVVRPMDDGHRGPVTNKQLLAAIELFAGHILDQSMKNHVVVSSSIPQQQQQQIADSSSEDTQGVVRDGSFRVNDQLRSNQYWQYLSSLDFGQDLLLPIPDPLWTQDQHGLADCVKVGIEYDLDYWVLPVAPGVGLEGSPDFGDFGQGPPTYEDPLEGIWSVREWVGLGLMSSTLVFAVSLSWIASFLQKRREREEAWGAVLTEEGVGEILQVGWRYQQGMTPPKPKDGTADLSGTRKSQQQQQQELFLQIYDKTRLGYNDDNSMLQGGVEKQQYWGGPSPGAAGGGGNPSRPPTTTNTTETATTMTPPPISSSNGNGTKTNGGDKQK